MNRMKTIRGFAALTLFVSLSVLVVGSSAFAATFLVTNVNDSGAGSLRQAILDANAAPGVDLINFSIPTGAGASFIIKPLSALPAISDPVIVDGYSQPFAVPNSSPPGVGNNATLLIQLDGTLAGVGASGLSITAGGSTVRGLVIHSFAGDGITMSTAGGNVIEGNYVGIDSSGTTTPGNSARGVLVNDQPGNVIGGTTPAAQNIISGNGTAFAASGVAINGSFAIGNVIQGNLIGTDRSGTVDLGNSGAGVSFGVGAVSDTIGGTTASARNIISGNDLRGITISTDGNTVLGNYIGTDITGVTALPNGGDGLAIFSASNNVVGGSTPAFRNIISGNAANGILITGTPSTGNFVTGNYIGTDVTGTLDVGNGGKGVDIFQAPGNTVGGTVAGAGNVISGNTGGGVRIVLPSATGNLVQGNLIGTNASGTAALANGAAGVEIQNAVGNTIGGTAAAARNTISGNQRGVFIGSPAATGNVVLGNYIGTDINGTAAIPNSFEGVLISGADSNRVGGTTAGARNIISGNTGEGISIFASGPNSGATNRIQGNYIGTDVTGGVSLSNGGSGVRVDLGASDNTIGGTVSGARNVISGNGGYGVQIAGAASAANRVQGNLIGTDVTGTAPLANSGGAGVLIFTAPDNIIGGTTTFERNIISGNTGRGVSISGLGATGNFVLGNYIGTDISGAVAIANLRGVSISGTSNNTVGGTFTLARNIISGNLQYGVDLDNATANVVQGNYIGTDATGLVAAIPNGSHGVHINFSSSNNAIGGNVAGAGNVISGNNQDGVAIISPGSTSNLVYGNLIGTDAAGTGAIGNANNGVRISGAVGNRIGNSSGGNVIAFNNNAGVSVPSGTGNSVLNNSIFSNGGLGIDLGTFGVTANDSDDVDTGANNLQNFPVVTAVSSGSTIIDVTFNSAASTVYGVQFFSSTTCDPSGNGEGETFLGDTTVVTDGSGNATFNVTFPATVPAGHFITAAATDPGSNTSEFSVCVEVIAATTVAGDIVWSRQLGSLQRELGDAVALDATGVYIGGVTFGAIPGETSSGGDDGYIRKYDLLGTPVWTVQFGTSLFDELTDMVSAGGALYVCGSTEGNLGGTNQGLRDAFVRKYDLDGNPVWSAQLGTVALDVAFGVAVSDDAVYVSGYTDGDLAGVNGGLEDAFLVKIDPTNGNVIWTRQWGGAAADRANAGVTVDGSDVYVAGISPPNSFLRKYDSDGNLQWVRPFQVVLTTITLNGIASYSGGIYVAGLVDGPLFGVLNGPSDAFVARYDRDGNLVWGNQFGTSGTDEAQDVHADAAALYVSGFTDDTFVGETSAGGIDAFVRRYDHGGNVSWTSQYGSPGVDFGRSVVSDLNQVYVAGEADDDMILPVGGFDLNSPALNLDAILTKLDPGPVPNVSFGIPGFNVPSMAVIGEEVGSQISLSIVNQGTDGVFDEFVVQLYAAPGDFIDPGDPKLINGTIVIPGIGAGDTIDVSIPSNAAIPPGAPIGGGFLGVIVDDTDVIPGAGEQTVRFITIEQLPGGIIWVNQFGGIGSDVGVAIVEDQGKIYSVGTNTSDGTSAFINAYFPSNGAIQWSRQIAAGNVVGTGVAVDASGVYMVGRVEGALPGQTEGGNGDMFIRKYSFSGFELWTDQFGSIQTEGKVDIAVDATGVYVTGYTDGTLPGAASVGGRDLFVRKYDFLGGVLFTRQFGTVADDAAGPGKLSIATGGGVYIGGNTNGVFPGFTNAGAEDAIVVRLDTLGNDIWVRQFGTTGTDEVRSIAIRNGLLVVGGTVGGALPGKGYGGGSSDSFVRRYTTGGTEVWTDQFGDLFDDVTNGIAVGTDGSIYVSGQDTTGAVARRYDTSGNELWANQFGGLAGFGVHSGSPLYITGTTTTDFPGQTGSGGVDAFVINLESGEELTGGADPDGDGVPDSLDMCPAENASFFDRDGDGCIDVGAGARHIEYWGKDDSVVTYVINEDGVPGITGGTDFTAIQNGVEKWTSLPNVDIAAVYGGPDTLTTGNGLDRINLITFHDDQYNFSSFTLAVGIATSFTTDTIVGGRTFRPGEIFDADILFNPQKQFTTQAIGGIGSDTESTTSHEAGHFFGMSHSAVITSTMFYVLPPNTNASTLETEDKNAFTKAYPTDAFIASANSISGTVTDGNSGLPVPGAIVFCTDATTGDTVGCEYTLPDGSYSFMGMPDGNFNISIYPLNGTSAIGQIQKGNINALVDTTAVTLFVPESWDMDESNADDPLAVGDISVISAQITGKNIITNVDNTPPSLVTVSPAHLSVDQPIVLAITILFDEAIDDGSIQGNFALRELSSGLGVSGIAGILSDATFIGFTPTEPLKYGIDYELTLGSGLADLFGNVIGTPIVVSFRTLDPPPVQISSVSPSAGVPGALVTISGLGFDPVPTSNEIQFQGALGSVVDTSPTQLVVEVPDGALTGALQVIVGPDTSTAVNFTVLPGEEVIRGFPVGSVALGGTPRQITVLPGGTHAYVATDVGIVSVVADPERGDFLDVELIPGSPSTNSVARTPTGNRVYGISRIDRTITSVNSNFDEIFPDPLFNTVLNTMAVGDEPVGIAISPDGRRAYVPTSVGTIQKWDVELGSATFEGRIGTIVSPDPNLRGTPTFDPGGQFMFVLTGNGTVLQFELGPDTLVQVVSVGSDPRDVVVEPTGQRAYVSDGLGTVDVLELSPLSNIATIPTGGTLRGITVTPTSLSLITANRQLNLLDVVDLDTTSPAFHAVETTIEQGVNPVDVDLTPNALYVLSILEESQQFVVTGIGFGPELRSLSHRALEPGGIVVLAGKDFTDSLVTVSFNGEVTAPFSRTDSALAVTVPLAATSGPVKVLGTNPTGPVVTSNPIFFDVLPLTPAPGILRQASASRPNPLFDVTEAVAMSPLGNQLAVAGLQGVQFIDTDPLSPTYNQEIGQFPAGIGDLEDVAFSPDGTKLYLTTPQDGNAFVMDARRDSPTYGDITTIDDSFFDIVGLTTQVAVSPDGSNVVIHGVFTGAPTNSGLFFIDATENPPIVIDSMGISFQLSVELVFHPTGDYLYLLESFNTKVHVVNMVANTPNFRRIVNTINIDSPELDSPNGNEPVSMAFFPDGQQALILAFDQALVAPYIHTMDTSDPVNITETAVQQPFSIGASPAPLRSQIDVSPRGDRAVVYASHGALYALDVTSPPYALVGTHLPGAANSTVDMDFTIDGFGVYAVSGNSDSMVVFDFSGVQSIILLSGDGQSGVVGQPLAAPLRVEISTSGLAPSGPNRVAGMTDVEGVPVTFEIVSGDGEFDGTRSSTHIVPTDANGIAEVRVTLGALVGNQVVRATTSGLGGSPINFTANAIIDPSTLPMTVSTLIPAPFVVDVSPTTAFQATFSRPVDTASVDLTSFNVIQAGETVPISGVYGYTDNDTRVSFTPSSPLLEATAYTLTITADVTDLDGGVLTNPSTSTFATITTSLPLVLEAVAPPSAAAFVQVVLSGTGFDPVATSVLFNDVQVTPDAATIDAITATVPPTAESGDLRVVSGPDTSNAIPFTFLIPAPTPVTVVTDSAETVVGVNNLVVNSQGTWAWMVSPGGNAVVPLDIVNVRSEAAIPVGQNPIGIALLPDGSRAYVANHVSGDVTVINTDPMSGDFNTVIATIFNVGDGPLDIIVSPDGDRIIVANGTSQDIAFIDTDFLSATYHEVLTRGGTSAGNKTLVMNPDGTILWVGTSDGYLTIDPVDFGVLTRTGTNKSTKLLVLNPDATLLFLLTTEGEVLIIDVEPGSASENEVLTRVGGGGGTKSISLNPDATLLYMVQEENDIVIVVSIETSSGVSVFEPGSEVIPGQVTATIVDTIDAGEDPAALAFVPDGSLALLTSPGDNSVVFLRLGASKPMIQADVTVFPRILIVLDGPVELPWFFFRWMTAWIKLPLPYEASNIDFASLRLNGVVPADSGYSVVGTSFFDGREYLKVRFDRVQFQQILPVGWIVPADITGDVAAGNAEQDATFWGGTTILTIRPSLIFPHGGELLAANRPTTIRWLSPDGYNITDVDIHWTPDDGETWLEIASGIPDAGEYTWTTPNGFFDACRISVSLYSGGTSVGSSITPETFTITAPVAVTLAGVDTRIDARSAVIAWQTSFETGIRGFHVLRSDDEYTGYQRLTQVMIASAGTRSGAEYEYRDGTIRPNRTYFYKLEDVPDSGPSQVFGPWEIHYKVDFGLEQNYPNPFNPTTTIQFTVANDAHVRLIIYDVAGRRVRTLVNEPRRADHYEIKWDGKTNSGAPVASGVYFYRMTAGKFVKTKKMVMLK